MEKRYQAAYDELVGELEREPTRAEIANRMGVAAVVVEDVARYRERAVAESFESLQPHQLQPCAYTLEDRDERLVLESALSRLTDAERKVIIALYAGGYTQSEIAQRLGYSRRHISRLHRGALKKMRPVWVRQSG